MVKFVIALLPQHPLPWWGRYLGALLLLGLAYLAHETLRVPLADYPLLLIFPTVVLTALLFDWDAGFLATLLGTLLAGFVFIPPRHSLALPTSDLLPLAIFAGTCLAISLATGALGQTVRALARSEARQRLLFDELEHRIKNDLTMVVSVLELQARAELDVAARHALEGAIVRINAIARAHDRLHQDGDRRVRLAAYLEALCGGLSSLLCDVRPVRLSAQVDDIEVDAREAISIGLMVNELVTNAFKYAFPSGRAGRIEVRAKRHGDWLQVEVQDDGIGCAGGTPGMGERLVRLLVKQQGGQLERLPGDQGCHVRIQLPLEKRAGSPDARAPRGPAEASRTPLAGGAR